MDLNEYQEQAFGSATYPDHHEVGGVIYTALGLAGEAGEITNKVKKILRDDDGILTDARRNDLIDELGDVLWYAATLADELGADLDSVARANLTKLKSRKHRGVLSGSGDNR